MIGNQKQIMNENTTTYREKGRALFLTAIMVLSVVAMAASLGAAPAAAIDSAETTAEDIDLTEGTVTQEINFTLQNGTDYADSGSASAETTINVTATGADLSVSGVTLDNATVVGGTLSGTQLATTDVTNTSDPANDDVNVTVDESALSDGDANAIDITVTVTYDDGTVASGLTHTIESDGGSAGSGDTDTTPTFDVLGLEITNVEPAGDQVIEEGTDVLYNVTVENTGANDGNGVSVEVGGSGVTDTNNTAVPAGETREILEINPSTSNLASGDKEDVTVTALSDGIDDTVTSEVTARDSTSVFISGPITDKDNLANIDSDTVERFEVTVTEVNNTNNLEIISDVKFGDFDTLASSNQYVDSASFIRGQPDQYTLDLATFGASGNQYEFEVTDPQGEFTFQGGATEELEPGQNDDQAIRLTRLENASRLTVLDAGERTRIVDDIDNGDVPISPDPQRLVSTTVEVENTVTLDVFTESSNSNDFGTDFDELAPFDNQTGEVEYQVVDVSGPANNNDLDFTPASTTDTDENGLSSVVADYTGGDIQQAVTFTVTFNATSNASEANDVVDITFQPSIGDTGTISGEIAKINDDIQLGVDSHGESNTQPAQDVPVWAVQADRVINGNADGDNDNTVIVENDSALDMTPPQRLEPEADNADKNSVRVDEAEGFRVVTYQGGEANVLDVRSDYLVTTPSTVEVIQNETSLGFEIYSDTGGDVVTLHFLEQEDYQVQQRVTWTNQSSNEVVGQSWQNVSVGTDPGSLHDDTANQQGSPSDLYSAGVNITLAGIDARYDSNDRIVPIDYTNENGDFELLNLPTNQGLEGEDADGKEYVVIAGAGDTVSADGADQAVGFANFRGYDIVTVHPNAQESDNDDDQYNVDLSVQDFEVDITYSYDLEVVVREDDGSWDDDTRIETGSSTDVGVLVQASNLEDGSSVPADSDVLQGQEITLSNEGPATDAGDLASTTLTVDDNITLGGTEYALATTTYNADAINAGTTNISASTTNDDGDLYETDPAGVGNNDEGDQAQIEVFKTIEVTGDVVNENDDNVKGARVLLFETNTVNDPTNLTEGDENVTAVTNTGVEGSYVFTDVETGTEYSIKAIALDGDGNRVTNIRQLNDGNPVNTALGGEDIVVIGASPDQPLETANFEVSNLNPADGTVDQGDDLTVTADVENTGAIEATQDITLSITNASGDEVFSTTQSLKLDVGDTQTVSFTLNNVQLDAGDYNHTVASDDDSVEGSLTVNETQNGGSEIPSWAEPYVDENGVATLTGASQAITDYNNGDLGLIRASNIITSYNTQTPIQDIVSE
jgi:surface glycoprotein (TIGR04207 family)